MDAILVRANSINTRGVMGVTIVSAVFMDQVNNIPLNTDTTKTKQLFNKYVDIIVVLLGISLLSVWGAFARIGRTEANLCMQHESHTAHLIGSCVIMIGVTFGLYSALKYVIDDRNGNYTASQKTLALGVLTVLHVATLVVLWSLYGDVVKYSRMDEAECDEFFGQQHMFLNVAFMGTIISAVYVFYAWVESIGRDNRGQRVINGIGHGLVYGGITFIFFYYASADAKQDTSFWDDKTQLAWTWATSGVVFLTNVVSAVRNKNLPLLPRKRDVTLDGSNNGLRIYAFIAFAVVATNIGLATNVLITDVKELSHSGVDGTNTTVDKDTSKGSCLEQDHDDILSMGITVTGYWTLYILILSAALVQYAVQIAKVEDKGCVYELRVPGTYTDVEFTFRDKFAGLNMPTVWVVVTYLWLLAGGVMHHSKLGDSGCGANDDHELYMFILHSVGVFAVLIVFPLWSKADDQIDRVISIRTTSESELRPTNRFNTTTNKAQVAVDVNTPLNFA